MLIHPHASGHAVHDDAQSLGCHVQLLRRRLIEANRRDRTAGAKRRHGRAVAWIAVHDDAQSLRAHVKASFAIERGGWERDGEAGCVRSKSTSAGVWAMSESHAGSAPPAKPGAKSE